MLDIVLHWYFPTCQILHLVSKHCEGIEILQLTQYEYPFQFARDFTDFRTENHTLRNFSVLAKPVCHHAMEHWTELKVWQSQLGREFYLCHTGHEHAWLLLWEESYLYLAMIFSLAKIFKEHRLEGSVCSHLCSQTCGKQRSANYPERTLTSLSSHGSTTLLTESKSGLKKERRPVEGYATGQAGFELVSGS